MATISMWFLKELELYKTVKPYRLDFDPEGDAIPRTNVERVQIPDVPVEDLRAAKGQLQFSECGFALLDMPPSLTGLDYDNNKLVANQYYSFIESSVQEFSESPAKAPKFWRLTTRHICTPPALLLQSSAFNATLLGPKT